MKKIMILALLIGGYYVTEFAFSRDAAWSGRPQSTLAEQMSLNYDAQSRVARYSNMRFVKTPRNRYSLRPSGYYPEQLSLTSGDATNLGPEHIGLD